jgi:hypothetical protein
VTCHRFGLFSFLFPSGESRFASKKGKSWDKSQHSKTLAASGRAKLFRVFSWLPLFLTHILNTAILWVTCDLPPKKALLAGVILLVYKIALSLIISSLLA